ncbi:hypothetical protein GJ496_000793 [Pomphorhynchus laevis]|nr:hypothetical protein GJ496_000793 [Pomphorhynchus laevis]
MSAEQSCSSEQQSYVTVALNDNEAIGALVLAKSLKQSGTLNKVTCLVDNISANYIDALNSAFDIVEQIQLDADVQALLENRLDLRDAVLKLQCWKLTRFSKCVFLDPACLVLQNTCDLFDREELSASSDTKWPDHFNAGVFVYRPCEHTYQQLITASQSSCLVDVSFQVILNNFFSKWSTEDIAKHLPFTYNVTPNVFYTYQPALRSFKENVRIIQFTNGMKPWNTTYDIASNCVENVSGEQQDFYSEWWKLFNAHVKSLLDSKCMQCVKVTESIHVIPYSQAHPVYQSTSVESKPSKQEWETGQIDYMGKDSFDNIQKKLDKSINE